MPNTLEIVKGLLNGPYFNIENPNKVRALVGTFASNLVHFHAKDGSGYKFFADQVIALDKNNPTVSARMASMFSKYAKLDDIADSIGWRGGNNRWPCPILLYLDKPIPDYDKPREDWGLGLTFVADIE